MVSLHDSPLEWIFFISSMISCALSIFTLRDAIIDSAYLRASGKNGNRRIVADANIRGEQFRLSISAVMMLASFTSLFLEPPPPDYIVLPQSAMLLGAWIVVSTLMSGWSLIDSSARHKFSAYADAVNPSDPVTGAPLDPSRPIDNSPAIEDRRNIHTSDRRTNGHD